MWFLLLSSLLINVAHSNPLAISARVASTMEAAMGDVLSSVGLPPPGCNAAPPLVCGGKDLIPN